MEHRDTDLVMTTEAGNTYRLAEYVDPFPGRHGDSLVWESCGACSGTGVYQGPSGLTFHTPAVGAVTKGCFQCHGNGGRNIKVSSVRARERRLVKAANQWAAEQADYNAPAAVAAREAAEAAREAAEAAAEEARLAAKEKGHVGSIGDRLKKIQVTVVKAATFESRNYVTGAPELKAILVFKNEDGRILKAFTGSTYGLEEGATAVISGTVKAHSNYDGQDQTDLARTKIH